jgi:hypothetical protein
MANQADVRVRLSAEGQAEVIAAFQKIASEGKKFGAEAGEAFKDLNSQLKDVAKTLTGGLGIVLVAEKFREFFKSTLDGAETMTRLSKQTGLSTDLIQGFGRAARETGVDQETANNALAKFTVNVGKAGIGSKASRDALSDLGISIKDFSKLAPDAQFQLVAQKLAAIPDPARRARDEVALFSRAGVQLDQALQAVGKEGLDPFIQHMKDLGIFLDTDTIASIKAAAESFKNLNDTVKGLATQFLTGLVPGLQAATDELLRATTGPGVNGFKKVGEIIGDVFRTAVNYIEHAGNNIAGFAAKAVVIFKNLKDQAANIFNPSEVKRLANQMGEQLDAIQQANEERNKEADDRLNAPIEKPKAESAAGGGGEGAAGANAAALAKARLAMIEANLENELKLYQAHAALVKESDKAAYDAGSIALSEYFARRAAQISAEADKELALLKAKRQAVATSAVDTNDPVAQIKQKQDLAAIDNQIAIEQVKRDGELAQNAEQQAAAQRKVAEDQLKTEEKLLEIAGKKTEAAKLKLALDIEDLDAELRKAGIADAPRAAAVGQAATQGAAQIDFGAASAKAQQDLATLTSQEKSLQDQVRSGELFSIDAAGKTVAAQRQMLPVLEQDAQAMLALAKATGNAMDIEKAQQFVDKINQLKVSTNQVSQSFAQINQGIESAAGAGINKFLTDAVSGTKTLKESFQQMGLAMLQTLEQVAIKMIETAALKALFNSAGGFAGGGMVSSDASTAATIGFASGGQIRGPGSSTSDSIPALLSDKEFVVNAKATQQPGILPLLTAINGGTLKGINGPSGVPKFAAGGAVGGSARPQQKIVNVLDPTLLGDHLATAAGESSVLNVISRNPNKVRSSLG